MGWEEALRRLDEQLSQGRISYEQYRARSEDVLAEAAGTRASRRTSPARKRAPADPPASKERNRRPSAAELLASSRPTTAPSPADDLPTERFAPPPRPAGHAWSPVPRPAHDPAPWRRNEAQHSSPGWLPVTLAVLVLLAVIIGAMWWIGTLYHARPDPGPAVTGGIPHPAEPAVRNGVLEVLPPR